MKKRYHIAETDDVIIAEGDHHDRITSTRRHVIAEQILTKFDPDEVYENHPTQRSGTSYTISKGESMYLCVRQTESRDLVDENTLIFVILHELAHIGTYDEYSHSPKFWSTFRFLLDEAVLAGVYERVDYAVTPSRYCGMTINYQPMDDTELIDIDEYEV
jgi:hypothetical protein